MKPNILVASKISEEAIELAKKERDVDIDFRPDISEGELEKEIRSYDAIVVRSRPKVTRKAIENAEKLKVIARAGIGVDNIDVSAATEKGIIVINAPEATTNTVAEHTFALILALARKITLANESMKKGRWEKNKFMGVEIKGKTLGIVGLGRIGSRVAELGKAFGMHVIAYDPYISEERALKLGVELKSFEDVVKNADFLTLHVPKTQKTINLISEKELKMMKKSAYLINCARGGIVDEKALYSSLKNREIAGAALDVFEKEPPGNKELLSLDNLIATPHLGASTVEAQSSAGLIVMEEVLNVLHGKIPRNIVNMPMMSRETFEKLKKYILLAENLGIFAFHFCGAKISEVYATYCGELAREDSLEALTSAFFKGFLSPILLNSINYINAMTIARNRGIKITQGKREDAEEYENLMIFFIRGDKEETMLKASLVANKEQRIVGINSYKIDFELSGKILVISHEDKPGMIGKIATKIGENNVNIASMEVGRKKRGEKQLMILKIDEDANQKLINELSSINGVIDVRYVKV